MTPLQAHLRLLENTPKERIRTHERTFRDSSGGGGTRRDLPMELIQEYRRMVLAGFTMKEVRKQLQVGTDALRNLARMADRDGRLADLQRRRRVESIRGALERRHSDPDLSATNLKRLREGLERKRAERSGL